MKTPHSYRPRCPVALTVLTVLALAALFAATSAYGQANAFPPGKMTFQGFLTDASTPPVPLGNASSENKTVLFKIYKSAAGTAVADVLWAEQQVITVDKGHFSVLLGEGSSVSGLPHATDLSGVFIGAGASERWIGITVDGAEITPRIQFFAAPYAQLARAATSLLNSSGQTILNFANGKLEGASELTVTGSVASSGSGSGLIFGNRDGEGVWQWYASGGHARLWTSVGPADRFVVTSDGKVGIGTSTPAQTLDVNGKITVTDGGRNYPAGISTELGSQLLQFGINEGSGNRFGTANTAVQGGMFRLDTRPGEAAMSIWTRPAGDTSSAGTQRFAVLANGNVGVGTMSPGGRLEVNSSSSSLASPAFKVELAGANLVTYKVGTSSTTLENTSGGSLNLQTQGGNVGINTPNPSAHLHVNGNMKIEGANVLELGAGVSGKEGNAGKVGYQTFSPGNPGMLDIVGAGNTGTSRYIRMHDALYITGWAVAPVYHVQSDARIKQVTARPVGESSLESIRRLQVTDFQYVDSALHGLAIKRGFIAQEIEKVLPNAITQSTDFVPDIYALAVSNRYDSASKALTIELKDPHGLNLGDLVRLNLDRDQKAAKVIAVLSSTRFVVEAESEPGKVFVFGKQVNDFRTVDYNHIFTTAISAIQELDSQVRALKQSEARIAELEQKAARVDSLERKVAQLEKLVAGLAQGRLEQRSSTRNVAAAQP